MAESAEGVAGLVAAFDAEHAGDFACGEGLVDGGGGGAELEMVRIVVDETLGEVDLFEGVADGPLQHC